MRHMEREQMFFNYFLSQRLDFQWRPLQWWHKISVLDSWLGRSKSLIAFLILESAGVLVFIFAPELIGIFIDAQKEPEVIKI